MPLSGSNKIEYQREYMRRKRSNKTGGLTAGLTGEGVTRYRPILYALADPNKRRKLKRICESLTNHKVLGEVYYGMGCDPLPLGEVERLLTAFE